MEIVAKQTYVRGSQQKLRDVVRAVKHMKVPAMRSQLSQMNREAARKILITLDQAVANAQHNFGISEDKLTVKEILVLRGPHYKRMRAVSRGMGHAILKRTNHIVITLASVEAAKPEESSEQQVASSEEKKKPVVKRVASPATRRRGGKVAKAK